MRRRNQILCVEISIFMFILFLMSFFELISYGVSSSVEEEKQFFISEDTYKTHQTLAEMDSRVLYKPSFNYWGTNGSLPSGIKSGSFFNGIWRAISFLLAFVVIKNIFFIQRDRRLLAHFLRCAFWPAFYLFKLNILQKEDGKKRIKKQIPGMI